MALKLNLNYVGKYADKEKFDSMRSEVSAAHKMLTEGTGLGSDFLGWLDLPVNYDKDEFRRIKESAEKIKKDSEVLVVLGIGGSYLGARAVIEFIKSNNYNLLKKDTPDIYFGGNTISSSAVAELMQLIDGREFSINVISKSGTTTEPLLSVSSRKSLRRNTAKKRRLRGYMSLPTGRRALSRRLPMPRDTRPS